MSSTGGKHQTTANRLETGALRAFAGVVAGMDAPDDLLRLFEEVLTPAERRDVALRWELMRRLYDGEPQRRIAETLGISLCKITRGSKVLKAPNSVSAQQLRAAAGQPIR